MGSVNCGTCNECCKGPDRHLILNRDYPDLETYTEGDYTYLARKENGDCVYLDGNCTIYEKRPDECRDFDCRDFINHPDLPERVRIQALKRL